MDIEKVKNLLGELLDECNSVRGCNECLLYDACIHTLDYSLSEVCGKLLLGIEHEENKE